MDRPLLALTRRRSGAPAGPGPDAIATENMRQLVQLRWIAVCGQLLTIIVVDRLFGAAIPVFELLAVVALLALFNLATTLVLRHRRATSRGLLTALLFDVGSLTLQLYLTGGAANPFISLYLLQVVLGAILLSPSAVALLLALTGLCFGFLSLHHRPLILPPRLAPLGTDLYQFGNWLGFLLVASLLVLFMGRISRNLRSRELYLAALRQQEAEEDQIVRMGLFASAAAHELGSPLASLDVTLNDWSRMPRLRDDDELAGEICEMQAEVRRCKAIITDVLQPVSQLGTATLQPVPAGPYLQSVVDTWRQVHPAAALRFDAAELEDAAVESGPALRQAIWNLLENASQAGGGEIALLAERQRDMLVVTVCDQGTGFSETMLAQFGTPAASDKGAGHGVGLFLVANVARRLGGGVEARNLPGGGAEVRLSIRLAPGGKDML